MKLTFKLNENNFDCNIGYSLLNAASERIKSDRMAAFRATLEVLASQGAGVDTKDSMKRVLEEHIYTQIPSDDEVKQWLGTLDGKRFALIYGTRKMPTKLSEDLADTVLDDMPEEKHSELSYAIETLCFGAVIADLTRQSSEAMLSRAKVELEKAKNESSTTGEVVVTT